MPLTWQKSISRTMDVCRIILDAVRKFVFAFSQDCKNVQEMVSNSNRLFSHCFRKTKNQQPKIFVSR